MHVQRVQWVTKKGIFNREYTLSQTFFSMESGERLKYAALRQEVQELESVVQGNQEAWLEHEPRVRKSFQELVGPYFERQGLILAGGAVYFRDRDIKLESQPLLVFEEDSYQAIYQIKYDFDLNPQLSCSSRLSYVSDGTAQMTKRYDVMADIFQRTIENKNAEGMRQPVVAVDGAWIEFASTDHAYSLLQQIQRVLKRIGKEDLEHLAYLYRESKTQDALLRQVLEKAYEFKREEVLLQKGLVRPTLKLA